MPIDRVAAKAAGYTDAEIDAYEAQQAPQQPQQPLLTPAQQRQQQVLSSLQSRSQAGFDPLRTLVTGAAAEIPAGLAGTLQALNPFADPGAGAQAVEATRQTLTAEPSPAGAQALSQFAEMAQPVTDVMRAAETGLGDVGMEAFGPVGGAIGETIPTAILTGLGLGAGKFFKNKSLIKEKIGEKIAAQAGDVDTASFKVTQAMHKGAPKVTKDPIAIETIRQGFDEGVVAAAKGASRADKKAMLEMTKVMERGKQNARYAMTNRPTDIVGDSLLKRFNVVLKANKQAGSKLDSVAKSLRGKAVNSDAIANQFIDDLGEIGIKVTDDLMLDFSGSDIAGLDGPMKAVSRVFNRMKAGGMPDAHDLHRMKRFIDEQVTYGKNAEGLAGRTEQVLKGLRRNIDDTLDKQFPAYDKVNTKYSETIGVLDDFQDVAGKKLDMLGPRAEKAAGTLMRRVMSNAQSRVNLLDVLDDMERMAAKYGGKFNDDLLTQVLYADELDSVFGPSARTSFQGQIGQAIGREVPTSARDVAVGAARAGIEKLRGINQENAFKSVKKLLEIK